MDYGEFTAGLYVARVPVPRSEVPLALKDRFPSRRPIFLTLGEVAYVLDGIEYRVAKHFYTDFASVPLWAGPSAMTGKPYDACGVLHDALRRCAGKLGMPWSKIDLLFRTSLRSVGFSRRRSWWWWLAVRSNAVGCRVRRWRGKPRTDMTNPEGLVAITRLDTKKPPTDDPGRGLLVFV